MSGNYFKENLQIITPTFKIPLTDKMNIAVSQQGRLCGYFETHFFKCMEAFGPKLGRQFCDLEHRDYRECITKDKQRRRVNAIRKEHWKQYLRGERKTPFEDHIKIGEYFPIYYEHMFKEM